MKFELSSAKAVLRGDVRLKGREVKGGGHVTGTTLILEIDASTCRKQVERLFPGSTLHDKEIAGRDDLLGEKRIAGTKLQDARLQLTTGELRLPVLNLEGAELKTATLKTLKKEGDGWGQTLIVKARVKLSSEEREAVVQHFDGDVFVSLEAMPELDLSSGLDGDEDDGDGDGDGSGTTASPELTGEKGAKPPKRRGKGKAAAEKAPPLRTETRDLILKSGGHKVNLAWMDDGVHWALPTGAVASGQGCEESEGLALEAARRVILDALEKPATSVAP